MFDWLFGAPLAVGTAAPEFDLPDQNGKRHRLRDYRGRSVVLVFYPGDDTTICTKQLCEIRDEWREFTSRGIAVFGVNSGSAASHEKFASKYAYPFPLLVDKGKAVCSLYNTGGLIIRRTVYVIDAEGMIRYAQRGKPAAAEILAAAQ